MRNCNARVTGELCKRSATAALVACVAIYSTAVPTLGAALDQDVSGNSPKAASHAPVIRANPERVTLTDRRGSTEIQWDTGNGSMGFVFVTEDGRKPVVFAEGPRGSQVAPWIGRHHYVFELYGDDQQQTLLAKVTVAGFAESVISQRKPSWQGATRWVLIVGLTAVLYFAVYLSSTGLLRTTFPTEPTSSPRSLHVGRNLLLGITAFICVDAINFHSGFYVSILAPNSYAGRVAELTQAAKR